MKRNKCYPLNCPILGGRDSTRDLQLSPFQKYKISKNYFFVKEFKKIYIYCLPKQNKKCCPLSFPILGGRDSTRALHSRVP